MLASRVLPSPRRSDARTTVRPNTDLTSENRNRTWRSVQDFPTRSRPRQSSGACSCGLTQRDPARLVVRARHRQRRHPAARPDPQRHDAAAPPRDRPRRRHRLVQHLRRLRRLQPRHDPRRQRPTRVRRCWTTSTSTTSPRSNAVISLCRSTRSAPTGSSGSNPCNAAITEPTVATSDSSPEKSWGPRRSRSRARRRSDRTTHKITRTSHLESKRRWRSCPHRPQRGRECIEQVGTRSSTTSSGWPHSRPRAAVKPLAASCRR